MLLQPSTPSDVRPVAFPCTSDRKTVRDWLRQAFTVSLLLTTDPQEAEQAILLAIEEVDLNDFAGDSFLRAVVRHSLSRAIQTGASVPGETSPATDLLSTELRSLLTLPLEVRACFVLRILLGNSRQSCSDLLRLTPELVDEYTRAALFTLPCAERMDDNVPVLCAQAASSRAF